ncbi:MAG: HEAT repeat domain-containing protein, partial [Opitutaceae bacterium]
SAVPPLETLARRGSPPARVHALWSLRGLQALTDRAIVIALGDPHPGVRENAIRLAEARLEASGEVREKIMDLVSDPSPRVRLQVAFTIGESRRWNQAALLARIARENPDDTWIQSAVISSASEVAAEVLASVATAPGEGKGDRAGDFARRLAVVVGFQNDPARVARAIGTMVTLPDAGRALRLLDGLGEGLRLAGTTLAAADPGGRAAGLLRRARTAAVDASLPEPSRRAAVEVLGLLPYGEAAPAVVGLLAGGQPASLQQAAIGVLRAFPEPEVGATLVARFAMLAPPVRTRAIDALLERPERIEVLLRAIQRGAIPRAELSAAQGAALRRHGDPRVQELTTEVLGATNPAKRMDVQRAYLPALDLAGAADRGKSLFESRCAVCHRHAGVGLPFGPDLGGGASGGKERLLASIVDPNREVAPEFFLHAVDLKDGGTVAGIVKNETGTTLTLLQVGGVERTIARASIARRHTQRQSLMPEGLEGGLNLQDMADLIEFIANPGR